MNRIAYVITAALWLPLCSGTAAALGSPDDVLIENAQTKLTRGDYEADLQRVPPDMRDAFASDPKRLTTMLNNILIAKTLAAEARQEGTDRDPQVMRQIALETDRLLARVQLERIEAAAGAAFDARASDFLPKAQERYLLGKDKFTAPEQVRVATIFFDSKKDGFDAALARAKDARAKLLAGADFTALAKEISDDPHVKDTGGELNWFGAGTIDPDFSNAAFKMQKPGEISEPVRSRFGYHLIRFEERRPPRQQTFDEVKDQIMGMLRKEYVTAQSEAKLAAIRGDPNMKIDQKAVDALVYHVDPNLYRPTSQRKN